MKHKTLGNRTAVLVAGLALFALASVAHAGQGIYDPVGTCTGNNCQSLTLNGTYVVDERGFADCFQAQLYTFGVECVRLHVTHTWDADPESNATPDPFMVFTCPDGAVWRNDDGGSGRKPLIKAETFTSGWCTVQICPLGGSSGTDADFRLRYGRYNSGNRNCANPTPDLALPFSPSAVAEKKAGEAED